jgi:hypothetical protein
MFAFIATFLLTIITANEWASVLTLTATVLAFNRQMQADSHFLMTTWGCRFKAPVRQIQPFNFIREKIFHYLCHKNENISLSVSFSY